MADYSFSTTVAGPLDAAREKVAAALATEGFGILTEIDVAGDLKKKLDVDVDPYLILGACNPPLAHQALSADPEHRCPAPLQRRAASRTETRSPSSSWIPAAVLTLVETEGIAEIAAEVRRKLAARAETPSPAERASPSITIHATSPADGRVRHRRPVRRHRPRKVRTPQGMVLGNTQAGRPDGKCNREQTADGAARHRQG